METVVRNVRDIGAGERRVYETALGQKLRENQQVILHVMTVGQPAERAAADAGDQPSERLPEWCNVYDGLCEEQIAEIENVSLCRSDLSRPPT